MSQEQQVSPRLFNVSRYLKSTLYLGVFFVLAVLFYSPDSTLKANEAQAATVAGTVYSDEGTTAITSGPTVRVKVNGLGDFTGTADGSGVYSVDVGTISAGNVITVFLDEATPDAVTVTRAAGDTNISGLPLYQNRVIVRHEDAGPITNTNLDAKDSNEDVDIGFAVTSGNLTVADGFKLIVWTGMTYTPGGTITTSPSSSAASTDGDLLIQTGATLNASNNDISIGGDFTNSGTITITAAGPWWNSSWLSRRKITLNNSASSENLVNFPILVSLNSGNIDYAKTQNAGQDIRFVDSDGTTSLSYEIETWDEAGTSQIWVKVPQIDSGSITDHIWVYYDNNGASDGQDATGVWDSNYDAVWHMTSSGTNVPDSTTNNFDGTKADSTHPASTTAGRINGAQSFTADQSPANIINTGLGSYATFTAEFWISHSTTDGYGTFLADSAGIRPGLYINGGNNKLVYYDGTEYFSNASLDDNTWYHITVVKNGASFTYYLNGASDSSHTVNSNPAPLTHIGGNNNGGEESTGIFDEFRVSDAVRSADWVEATYNWANNNVSHNTFGTEETYGSGEPVITFTASATGHSIDNGTGNFHNLTFNGTGGGWSFSDSTNTIAGDLAVTAGTLSGTASMTVNGGGVTGNGTIALTDGTFTVDGTGNFGGNTNWTFSGLAFGDGSDTSTTTVIGSGKIIITDQFVVADNQTLDAGSKTFEIQTSGGDTAWWNDSWLSRKKIMLNNAASSENLVNFPILVLLSSSNIDYSKTQNSGQDIRFVDADGTTQLAHEIEIWNESDTSTVWVKVPQIDSGSTTDFVWVYYNNAAASDGQDAANVWDSNHAGVWHLPDGSTLTGADSTSNNFDGTLTNTPTATTGKIDGAGDFVRASNQYITMGDPAGLQLAGDWTISAWVYLNSLPADGQYYTIISKAQGSGANNYSLWYENNAGGSGVNGWTVAFDCPGGCADVYLRYPVIPNTSQWYHVAGKWNNTSKHLELYIDGVSVASTDPGHNPVTGSGSGNNFMIGRDSCCSGGELNGRIDEARVSNVSRSSDWIEAEYNWSNNPSTYNTFGVEESLPTFAFEGTVNVNTSTFEYTTNTAVGIIPLNYYNLILNQTGATYQVPEGGLVVSNNLTITAGTLDLNTADENVTVTNLINNGTVQGSTTANLTVTGDWTNNSTFTHNNGTVTFSPVTTSTITSGGAAVNIFYNFTATNGAGKTLQFEAGDETKFEGTLTLSGTSEGLLAIDSTTTTQWELWLTGSVVANRLSIKNSGCYSGTNVVPANDTVLSKGNNGSCWSLFVRGGGSSPTGGGSGGSGAEGGGGSGSGGGPTDGGSGGSGAEGGGGSGSGGGGVSP